MCTVMIGYIPTIHQTLNTVFQVWLQCVASPDNLELWGRLAALHASNQHIDVDQDLSKARDVNMGIQGLTHMLPRLLMLQHLKVPG